MNDCRRYRGKRRSYATLIDRARTDGHQYVASVAGSVEDSGEGRWTVMAPVEEGVPAEVLGIAL